MNVYTSIMVKVFTHGPKDWNSILGCCHTKDSKNGIECLLSVKLSIIRYGSRVRGAILGRE